MCSTECRSVSPCRDMSDCFSLFFVTLTSLNEIEIETCTKENIQPKIPHGSPLEEVYWGHVCSARLAIRLSHPDFDLC